MNCSRWHSSHLSMMFLDVPLLTLSTRRSRSHEPIRIAHQPFPSSQISSMTRFDASSSCDFFSCSSCSKCSRVLGCRGCSSCCCGFRGWRKSLLQILHVFVFITRAGDSGLPQGFRFKWGIVWNYILEISAPFHQKYWGKSTINGGQ